MMLKEEEAFHNKYEEALENIKVQFGRRYTMIINGKYLNTIETFVHTSPIDTRIILGYFPSGSAKHIAAGGQCCKKKHLKAGVKPITKSV